MSEASLAHRAPRHVVTAAAHRELQALVDGEADRLDDVRGPAAGGEQSRALVDEPVVDAPELLVGGVAGPDQDTAEPARQLIAALGGKSRHRHYVTPSPV
jgi:hypothetical protein